MHNVELGKSRIEAMDQQSVNESPTNLLVSDEGDVLAWSSETTTSENSAFKMSVSYTNVLRAFVLHPDNNSPMETIANSIALKKEIVISEALHREDAHDALSALCHTAGKRLLTYAGVGPPLVTMIDIADTAIASPPGLDIGIYITFMLRAYPKLVKDWYKLRKSLNKPDINNPLFTVKRQNEQPELYAMQELLSEVGTEVFLKSDLAAGVPQSVRVLSAAKKDNMGARLAYFETLRRAKVRRGQAEQMRRHLHPRNS